MGETILILLFKMAIKTLERILVIEDHPKHLEDAKRFFGSVDSLKTTYATSALEALGEGNHRLGMLDGAETNDESYPENSVIRPVDGVITDLFFPYMRIREWNEPAMKERLAVINEAPNGLLIAATCQKRGIPYVICTSGGHHGNKYEWANKMNRAMGGPEMIDNFRPGDRYVAGLENTEIEHKHWDLAFEALKKEFERLSEHA